MLVCSFLIGIVLEMFVQYWEYDNHLDGRKLLHGGDIQILVYRTLLPLHVIKRWMRTFVSLALATFNSFTDGGRKSI